MGSWRVHRHARGHVLPADGGHGHGYLSAAGGGRGRGCEFLLAGLGVSNWYPRAYCPLPSIVTIGT